MISKKRIAEKLIARYEELLEKGKKMNHRRFISFLSKHYAESGVCKLSSRYLEISLSGKEYVNKHKKCYSNGRTDYFIFYWYKTPCHSESKKEAIQCITERIKILKTW